MLISATLFFFSIFSVYFYTDRPFLSKIFAVPVSLCYTKFLYLF
ncbi:NADH-quinone oxidoreductase subunit J [Streptococcus sanguinis SK1057]|nr:NADH-quinone oxidoreductase subunit J [Streptococcus sanguinis SK1057]